MLDYITVYDDDGTESEVYVLEETQINGNTYVLVTEDEYDEESVAYILKQVGADDDEVYYESVDDEEELAAVADVFAELLDDFEIEM